MFKRNAIILVDMDGVLADFDLSLQSLWMNHPIAMRNGWEPWTPPDDVSGKALRSVLETKWGPEAAALFNSIIGSGDFYRNLPPIPRAVEGMHLLDSLGYPVFICTAPSRRVESCASEKIAWAGEHLGSKWIAKTIITKDKTLVHGDYLIDDKMYVTGIREPSWEHTKFFSPIAPVGATWDSIIDSLSS